MVNSKLKNIIVLKGMASNVVQEAIVILKPNIDLKKSDYKIKENLDKRKNIITEAEYVISSYVDKIDENNKGQVIIELKKKINRYKKICIVLFIGCFLGGIF